MPKARRAIDCKTFQDIPNIGPATAGVATPDLLALCNGACPVEIVPWLWARDPAARPGAVAG